MSKWSTFLCSYHVIAKLITTAFQLRTNFHVERYSETDIMRRRLYIKNNQMNWDSFV